MPEEYLLIELESDKLPFNFLATKESNYVSITITGSASWILICGTNVCFATIACHWRGRVIVILELPFLSAANVTSSNDLS